jgi:hypothetical protein
MAKQLFWANVRIPEHPRVRFFAPSPDGVHGFKDITGEVAKLIIEDPEEPSGVHHLLRLDKNDKLVWKTVHPSLQETKWHVEFEYGLPEEKWTACDDVGK